MFCKKSRTLILYYAQAMAYSFPFIQIHFCCVKSWNVTSLPSASVRSPYLICTLNIFCKNWGPLLASVKHVFQTVCYDLKRIWELCEQRKLQEADFWTRFKRRGRPQHTWDSLFGHQWKKSDLPNQFSQSLISWYSDFLGVATRFQSHNTWNMGPQWSTGEQLGQFIRRKSVYSGP